METPERIRTLRKTNHWTQEELATKINVSPQVISNWERNYSTPDADDIARLAEAFSVTGDFLLGLTDHLGTNVPSAKDSGPIANSVERNNMEIQLSESADNYRNDGTVMVPIVAQVACGEPIYTEDSVLGSYPLNPHLVNIHDGPYICVKAKGDSMVNARIFDGSLVLLRLQSQVDNGEIAAVCIDNETATLKRVYFLADGIRLVPENSNPEYQAITYSPERIRIVGKALTALSDLPPFK